MLSLYEILKASKTGIAPDMWAALAGANFGGAGSGAETKEITGIPPLSIRSNGTMLLDYLISGNMSQSSGTTTVPSKNVTVSSLESGTNYALFSKADFPNAVVGDTINIVVGGTSYSQKVMKIGTSYVYIENRTV
jgi:hypothetical protein